LIELAAESDSEYGELRESGPSAKDDGDVTSVQSGSLIDLADESDSCMVLGDFRPSVIDADKRCVVADRKRCVVMANGLSTSAKGGPRLATVKPPDRTSLEEDPPVEIGNFEPAPAQGCDESSTDAGSSSAGDTDSTTDEFCDEGGQEPGGSVLDIASESDEE